MKQLLLAVALLCIPIPAVAQVQLAPLPVQTFFDGSGRPLAGGFVYFFNNGTTVPAPTYTDASGTILNTNPVQLDSAGRAQIWLAQQTYTECVKDANNVQQFCVNGVTSGANLLTLTNTWTNPQTWSALGTFNAGLDVTGGLLADNLSVGCGLGIGGAPVSTGCGINGNSGWNISVANTPLLTLTSGNLAVNGGISVALQIGSVVPSGTPPLIVASNTQVANLNSSELEGFSWESPGTIGSVTPNSASFSGIIDTDLTLGACVQVQSTGSQALMTPLSLPCHNPSIQSVTTKVLGGNVDLPASTVTTIDSQSIIMPAEGCPCRVVITYSYFWETVAGSGADTVNMYVTDGANNYAGAQASASNATTPGGLNATQTTADYANSANVTFTVKAEAAQHQQIDASAQILTALKSYLELKVETSY